jgi:hypothetical protein
MSGYLGATEVELPELYLVSEINKLRNLAE